MFPAVTRDLVQGHFIDKEYNDIYKIKAWFLHFWLNLLRQVVPSMLIDKEVKLVFLYKLKKNEPLLSGDMEACISKVISLDSSIMNSPSYPASFKSMQL